MENIVEGKEQIIEHIQQRLESLKLQRDSLIRQSTKPEVKMQKVNISKFLQNQSKGVTPQSKYKEVRKMERVNNFQQFEQEQVYSKAEILQKQIQAKKRCEQLKDLLQKKKKLQSIGLYESEPNKIKRIFQNKTLSNDIHKNLAERQKQEKIRLEKEKIIQQQLTKAHSFLQQSKKSNNKKAKENEFSYTQLLLNKQNQLKQYEKLLSKKTHTLLQKENLLQKTFDILKQYPSRMLKNRLESFLLANHTFCQIFLITKAEILRDLSVYQTQQLGYLNYNQFYEFIKSIQITNKALKPNINFKAKTPASQQIQFKTTAAKKNPRQVEQYLRKIFNYLDQKKQRFVQRQRLQIALQKGLLIDKKASNINSQVIGKFSLYIKNKKQIVDNKRYYKKLDQRYIGMEQLLQLYKEFNKIDQRKQEEQQTEFYKEEGEQSEDNSQKQTQKEDFKQIKKQKDDQIQLDERNDFEKYGWQKDSQQQFQFAQLKQIDKYYKDLSNKHGNQIHWNGFQVYKQDFSKFNKVIANLRLKQEQSTQQIPFNFHAPVEQQEFQESQQIK